MILTELTSKTSKPRLCEFLLHLQSREVALIQSRQACFLKSAKFKTNFEVLVWIQVMVPLLAEFASKSLFKVTLLAGVFCALFQREQTTTRRKFELGHFQT